MRFDDRGYPLLSRASAIRCPGCERPFAAGHLPPAGVDLCRDCRADADADALVAPVDPVLFDEADQ